MHPFELITAPTLLVPPANPEQSAAQSAAAAIPDCATVYPGQVAPALGTNKGLMAAHSSNGARSQRVLSASAQLG